MQLYAAKSHPQTFPGPTALYLTLRCYVTQGREDGFEPLTGLGVGLPLSRLMARHFGGELHLLSVESQGTDAVLFLPREVRPERLPAFDFHC